MSNRDDFIAVVKRVKSALSSITDDQRIKLLTQARQEHKLTREEATKILGNEGLNVNNVVNYFEVLDLDVKVSESLSEDQIRDKADELYNRYAPDAGNPPIRKKLDRIREARLILLAPQKRKEHAKLVMERPKHGDLLFTFATTGIPQLETLMKHNYSEATQILYSGNLAKCLSGTPLAGAAKAVVSKFNSDKSMGMKAMVAIISEKIEFTGGDKASKPEELATMADKNKNWNEAKKLLYKGFFAIWLEYTNETYLATKTKEVVLKCSDDDIGLEKFIQELNPHIGKPKLEVNLSKIDFGTMNVNSKKTEEFEIINKSRGKLHGKVKIENDDIPNLRIEESSVKGKWIVRVEIDTSKLAKHKTHSGSLLVETNGGKKSIPITCYVDNPVQRSIQNVVISSCSVAAIALVTRLIIQQFGRTGWLSTRLTGTEFVDWPQYWKWAEWFEWPWFGWRVYTLSEPWADFGFVIALVFLGGGIFAYWHFLFKKKIGR